MSAPKVDTPRAVPASQDASATPRKRRKRTSTAGAVADCFTCQNSSTKCDRKRPYCSPCLNHGKDCSGYKTQLTWNVGVASRGKLRGLSLPIAGSAQRAAGPTSPVKQKRKWSTSDEIPASIPSADVVRDIEPTSPVHTKAIQTYPVQYTATSSGSSACSGNVLWAAQNDPSNAILGTSIPLKIEPSDGEAPLYCFGEIPHASLNEFKPSATSDPSSSYDLQHHISPLPYPQSPQSTAHFASPTDSTPVSNTFSGSRSYRIHDLLSPEPSHASLSSPSIPAYLAQTESYPPASYVEPATPQLSDFTLELNGEPRDEQEVEDLTRDQFDNEVAIVDDASTFSSPLPIDLTWAVPSFGNMTNIGKTPRMQYLINYYAEVISPVIVAFDGPTNPYRTQILRLAANSETLQHAISALAASNLRQRRETGTLSTCKTDPARRSSMAHLTLTDESFHRAAFLSPQEQAREEIFHKSFAIQSLNAQLANPVLRKNDSILATLLVLCLFHICDSGVAKFQTQFAGVKKLLNLRGKELGIDSKDARWYTRMFTWFDALTATVNEREGQLIGHHLDVTALSDEEWALENLAGCDGNLFKTISKLGRLNVLSQGKQVDESPTLVSKPLPNLPFTGDDFSTFDGNGWVRMISDEDLFTMKTAQPDVGEQFWREWRDARQALQTWRLDTSAFDSTSTETPFLTPEQRVDLNNVSESFRYSALLYTERLACPAAASSDDNIQAWVRQSLEYIKLVKSDVYLLWPLFITGSECVAEGDIDIIRQRCLDIQKDSGFFNNRSCLELLEKVWRENPAVSEYKARPAAQPPSTKQPVSGFRFSDVMRKESNEGEYIVV